MVTHNLPEQPYKKFFGRKDSIEKIKSTLVEGATFIASIDGVGGIGKTALAYYFCKEFLLPSKEFDTIVWITAKESVFDPFSTESMIKNIDNKFRGVETIVDTTLALIGFEDMLDQPMKDKKELFEEFVKSEPVFFVLDNLENVEDEEFFKYITHDFNKFAVLNKKLKVITTSRKRKKIIDFPIEIEGLAIEDALSMLKYLARTYNIKDILHATDHHNIKLIEKVGGVPLGIEFIIGQMTKGKSRGEIYSELEGYPSLEGVIDERERKKRLSDIILFSFQNMYEALNDKEKKIFQTIAALEKNKTKNDPEISLELLMSITNMSRNDLETSLEVLIENKLVSQFQSNSYTISQMAINFVKQYYDNFEQIEDEVIGKKQSLLSRTSINKLDKVDILINSVRSLIEKNEYEEAEKTLSKALDVSQDYRIFYELAKIQRILNKFSKAADNYRIATRLNPTNSKIWYDWINMEDNRNRYNIAMQIIEEALLKTHNNISIVLQKVSILKYKNKILELREEIEDKLKFYERENRKEDYIKLLRNWKGLEYKLFKDKGETKYFEVIEKLIDFEADKEIKLQLLREELNSANRLKDYKRINKIKRKISIIERSIIGSMNERVKYLNRLFNAKKYDEAKKEARKILNWIHADEDNNLYAKNALRILLQILASEKEYDRIIITFEDYKNICYQDENCINIYNKAKKEKRRIECEEIIKEISINIQHIEHLLRNIIMFALNYSEEELLKLLKDKDKADWLEQWTNTKNRAMKRDELLIYYSDLSHIRSLLSWTKSILSKKSENSYQVKQHVKNILAYLENYITKERNETFHARLQLLDKMELNKILVDTQRVLEEINNLTLILSDYKGKT